MHYISLYLCFLRLGQWFLSKEQMRYNQVLHQKLRRLRNSLSIQHFQNCYLFHDKSASLYKSCCIPLCVYQFHEFSAIWNSRWIIRRRFPLKVGIDISISNYFSCGCVEYNIERLSKVVARKPLACYLFWVNVKKWTDTKLNL